MINKIKAFLTAIFAGITSIFGTLTIPVLLLVACSLIDYATGVIAAPNRGEKISSKTGLRGIVKKLCMWLLVFVGAIIDELIRYAINITGFELPFKINCLIACIVAIWLVCNELISILENLKDIGVPLPGFLNSIVRHIKSQAEVKVNFVNEVNKDE